MTHLSDFDIQQLKEKISSSEIKTKINHMIRNKQLDEESINVLWDFKYFRWPVLRNQQLSSDKITEILKDAIQHRIHEGRKIIFYLIKYQDFTPSHYALLNQYSLDKTMILDIWLANPKDMIEYGDYDKFLEIVKDGSIVMRKNGKKFIKTIEHVCTETSKLYDILDTIIAYYTEQEATKLLHILVRTNYISDEYVNKIRNKIGEYNFKKIADILISRQNCSVSMKAKLMLLK